MFYETLNVTALTNNSAQLIAHEAEVDDREAAETLRDLYLSRGYIVRFWQDGCSPDSIEEFRPRVAA